MSNRKSDLSAVILDVKELYTSSAVKCGRASTFDSCCYPTGDGDSGGEGDIVDHVDHAGKTHGLTRDIFAVRCSVNRGPLMIDHSDLEKLNYLDEEFAPQDMDDHDLCYRAYKELNKIVGCYWIDYQSDDAWGGTRVSGQPAPWLFKAHHKNTKLFYERHKDLINNRRLIDNRELL